MYNSQLENRLIVVDIVNVMQDYCSIQIDIDETKVKAACILAQDLDIKRIIKNVNIQRCIFPIDTTDEELKGLVIPALCYYTYSRCLLMFQGTFTDSGYMIESDSQDRNTTKSVASEMKTAGDTYMESVIEFLELEDPNTEATSDDLGESVRVFGGQENRASN